MWPQILPPYFTFVFILSFFAFHLPVSSSPTSPSAPAYVPDPSGRGTIGLLQSCIITLSLCVWTAIHLNIDYNKNRWRRFWLKFRWALLALIGPEIVLWRAYAQRKSAKQLCDAMNNLPEEVRPKTEWTLDLGFFAVMGGFRVTEMEGYEKGCTLTPRGVLLLKRNNLLPEVDKDIVKDRSKADELAKGLVCIQAAWMILQVISRKASGLPVTLLELNTVAHVACAVLMYLVWWHKPQNVKQPEYVNVDADVIALLSPVPSTFRRFVPSLLQEEGDKLSTNADRESDEDSSPEGSRLINESTTSIPESCVRLLNGTRLEGYRVGTQTWEEPYVDLTEKEIERIRRLSRLELGNEDPVLWYTMLHLVTTDASNFVSVGDIEEPDVKTDFWPRSFGRSLPLLALLSALYGGVHSSSWNSHFPSGIEQILWRISACVVAGGGTAMWVADYYYEWLYFTFNQRIIELLMEIIMGFIALLFGVARLFLVIEAFISIRSLPVGAYSTPDWINFLPHIG